MRSKSSGRRTGSRAAALNGRRVGPHEVDHLGEDLPVEVVDLVVTGRDLAGRRGRRCRRARR